MRRVVQVLCGVSLFVASAAEAKTARFQSIKPEEWAGMMAGTSDLTVEFRRGDLLPVDVKASGDLLATKGAGSVTIEVQQTFYLKAEGNDLLLSVDGVDFAPITDRVSGHLSASASSDLQAINPVTHLSLELLAWLKKN